MPTYVVESIKAKVAAAFHALKFRLRLEVGLKVEKVDLNSTAAPGGTGTGTTRWHGAWLLGGRTYAVLGCPPCGRISNCIRWVTHAI